MITINELEHWLHDKDQPKKVVYHVGMLSKDRLKYEVIEGAMKIVTIEPLHSIAQMLSDLAEQGKVLLCQRRVQPHVFEYIAIRRK